jgi:hypothetical protein
MIFFDDLGNGVVAIDQMQRLQGRQASEAASTKFLVGANPREFVAYS